MKKRTELFSHDTAKQQEAQQQLKAAYRKASRLCHPDKLADEFKA